MKTRIKNLFLLPVLTVGTGLVLTAEVSAQTFTTLYSFTAGSGAAYPTNNDGGRPNGLLLSGEILYGTAHDGGSAGAGTVFAVNTDGTGFTTLHRFTAISDGGELDAGLILSGNTLYGTAPVGGSSGVGTVFAVNTDGTGFTNLHSFTGSDGGYPEAGLILSGNTLYGTAGGGGKNGTVFSLSFAPQLTISSSGANVILTWPTNYAGFDYTGFILQSTTNLVSPALWTTVSPEPVVLNGQNTVTNPVSGTQQFYRLAQ